MESLNKLINWEVRPIETLLFLAAIVGVFVSSDRRLTRLEEQQLGLRERIMAREVFASEVTKTQLEIARSLSRIEATINKP